VQRVERALGEIDEGRHELAGLAGPDQGMIGLGFLRSLGTRYVPELLRRFKLRHPAIDFTLVHSNSTVIEEKVERGELDLIFTTMPPRKPALAWKAVVEQEFLLIVPRSHRFAKRKRIALSMVSADPFVSFKNGRALRHLTDGLCRAAGFTPSIIFEGDDSSSVLGFVAAGFGVAIVPPDSGEASGVVSLRIMDPVARRTIGLAWVNGRYLAARSCTFRDFAIAPPS
jgi:DNA-binding transcriptional LysR family regulator